MQTPGKICMAQRDFPLRATWWEPFTLKCDLGHHSGTAHRHTMTPTIFIYWHDQPDKEK
jgi:hypothetical protein